MKIGISSDHRGFKLKEKIKNYFENKNIEYVDYGTNSEESVDYPDFALKVCNDIVSKQINLGILVCGTGIGMSIIANKVKGIRCGKVTTAEEAHLIKEHNMANVMALSENTNDLENILDQFVYTKESEDEKHIRRVNKIKEVENNG